MAPMTKSIIVLLLIGTFVSAQQVSSEEIVDCGEHELHLERLVGADTGFSIDTAARFSADCTDTLETFDIELEEERGGNLYKEIAIFAIVAAMVGYMVITLLDPGDEEKDSAPDGKDIPGPFFGISVPLSP